MPTRRPPARVLLFDRDRRRRAEQQWQLDQSEATEGLAQVLRAMAQRSTAQPPRPLTAAQFRAAGRRLLLFGMLADVTWCAFDPEYGRLWAEREDAWNELAAAVGGSLFTREPNG